MLSERYLKRRYEEGKAEGRAEVSRAWEEWNQRRIAAENAGEKFNEPPPSGRNGEQGPAGASKGQSPEVSLREGFGATGD